MNAKWTWETYWNRMVNAAYAVAEDPDAPDGAIGFADLVYSKASWFVTPSRTEIKQPDLTARYITMCRLRYDEKWTLQKIADLFELSRERVRQIVGNSGWIADPEHYKEREPLGSKYDETLYNPAWLADNNHKTNAEIAEELGTSMSHVAVNRSDHRHAVDLGNPTLRIADRSETVIADKLAGLGLSCELQPRTASFDILVNGTLKIDVKASSRPRSDGKPYYQFRVRKNRRDCDYYILYIIPSDDAFIVPADKVPASRPMIAFRWPAPKTNKGRKSKHNWQQYHERWELILQELQ